MKKIVLVLIIIICQSCVKKASETLPKEENVISEVVATEIASEVKIPSLSFEALEPLLNKKNDTTYVINFWATWCKPCVKELPAFEKINTEYASQSVKVILVSLDFPRLLEKQVIPFVEKRKIKSDVILLDDPDANTWIPKVSTEWSGAIPATIIYNKSERKFYERSFTYEEIETELKSILNK